MNCSPATIVLGLLLMTSATSVSADSQPDLKHNPFSRPPSIATVNVRPQLTQDGSVVEIDLRATMVGATNRIANVGGQVLRQGDTLESYTLLRVFEDRAIFLRDGKQLTVYVKPTRAEDDE